MIIETLIFIGQLALGLYLVYRFEGRKWDYLSAFTWIMLGVVMGAVLSVGLTMMGYDVSTPEQINGPIIVIGATMVAITLIRAILQHWNRTSN